jgi:hypothetical protein
MCSAFHHHLIQASIPVHPHHPSTQIPEPIHSFINQINHKPETAITQSTFQTAQPVHKFTTTFSFLHHGHNHLPRNLLCTQTPKSQPPPNQPNHLTTNPSSPFSSTSDLKSCLSHFKFQAWP